MFIACQIYKFNELLICWQKAKTKKQCMIFSCGMYSFVGTNNFYIINDTQLPLWWPHFKSRFWTRDFNQLEFLSLGCFIQKYLILESAFHFSLNPCAAKSFPINVIISGNILKFSLSNFFWHDNFYLLDLERYVSWQRCMLVKGGEGVRHLASHKDNCIFAVFLNNRSVYLSAWLWL